MSTMSTFSSWLSRTKDNLSDGVKRFKNKELLDAIVAGCALVAAADGTIESSEKQKMVGYLGRSQDLSVFNMSEVIDRFNHFAGNMEFDAMIGKQESLRVIGKFRLKPDVARVIVG